MATRSHSRQAFLVTSLSSVRMMALTVFGLLGCGRAADKSSQAADSAVVIAADSAVVSSLVSALDSCSRDGRTAARWSGSLRSFGRFALFLPDSARILKLDNTAGQLNITWPRCPDACRFSVGVYADSGVSLEARVAQLVAEQRRIYSANRDLKKEAMEFDELDAPPRPFTTAAERGYIIDHSCGDCAATTLKFGREGLIADVSLSADAVPEAGQRMCEMAVIGKTFSWRP